jgi:hypothetical protein
VNPLHTPEFKKAVEIAGWATDAAGWTLRPYLPPNCDPGDEGFCWVHLWEGEIVPPQGVSNWRTDPEAEAIYERHFRKWLKEHLPFFIVSFSQGQRGRSVTIEWEEDQYVHGKTYLEALINAVIAQDKDNSKDG